MKKEEKRFFKAFGYTVMEVMDENGMCIKKSRPYKIGQFFCKPQRANAVAFARASQIYPKIQFDFMDIIPARGVLPIAKSKIPTLGKRR